LRVLARFLDSNNSRSLAAWCLSHPEEAAWMEEARVRAKLGGYYPRELVKAKFLAGYLAILDEIENKHMKEAQKKTKR